MKIHVRELMHRLATLLETLVGLLMLAALFTALIGFVQGIHPGLLMADPAQFEQYLSVAAMLVIGVEFVKMLCSHTLDTVIEIMLLAIARQMIVEHTSPLENLAAVLSIGVLYLMRKYLYIPKLDQVKHTSIFDMPFLGRKPADAEPPEEKQS